MLDLLSMDLLLAIVRSLNPFSSKDAPTELQCGVYVIELVDGVATLDPLAVRTDKVNVEGYARVDFHTDELEAIWTTKPRKGVGLSASVITNRYIKLGGTLDSPSIEMKPLSAATATTVAVMTGGLSLLARGFWDRIRSTKKICRAAKKKAGLN
jgi:hypothetical protein